jgi:4-hydroxyphenylpyruvate dioxygenase
MASVTDPKPIEPDAANPMGTDGFEFVEYTAPDPEALGQLFESMGFVKVAKHRSKDVSLYRQGDVNFIVNAETESFAQGFARVHGPSVCAIAFRVKNAAFAYKRALSLGAWGVEGKVGPMELNIPAIKGIGDSLIYLVDRYGPRGNIYDVDFEYLPGVDPNPPGVGLTYIDHLTHNVHRGRMAEWADFYERLFNFREIRYFDIEGKLTGLKSKAMTKGVPFQDVPDTYYEQIDARLPGHGEDLKRLATDRILIDGAPTKGGGLLLQIFTQTVIGPIFFEIIQRRGNEGFGEGNFRALFESIELDQIRRGVLQDKTN